MADTESKKDLNFQTDKGTVRSVERVVQYALGTLYAFLLFYSVFLLWNLWDQSRAMRNLINFSTEGLYAERLEEAKYISQILVDQSQSAIAAQRSSEDILFGVIDTFQNYTQSQRIESIVLVRERDWQVMALGGDISAPGSEQALELYDTYEPNLSEFEPAYKDEGGAGGLIRLNEKRDNMLLATSFMTKSYWEEGLSRYWVLVEFDLSPLLNKLEAEREEARALLFPVRVRTYFVIALVLIMGVALVVYERKTIISTFNYLLRAQMDVERAGRALKLLEQEADTDVLTGMYSLRKFHPVFNERFRRAKDAAEPLVILFFDVDNFKEINDTYGHHSGDVVLKYLGLKLQHLLPDEERGQAFRIGGDEFVILLYKVDLGSGLEFAHHLLKEIKSVDFPSGDKTFRATLSIGVAEYNSDMKNPTEMKIKADQCLYNVKKKGKGGVSCTPVPGAEYTPSRPLTGKARRP